MDIFEAEPRSWEQFEVQWRTHPTAAYLDSYIYLLEWRFIGPGKNDFNEDMDCILLSTKSDGVSRDKNHILKYQKALTEKSFGGRVVVAITSLSLGDDNDICGGKRCCCSPCHSDPQTGIVTRVFYRCFDKHELFALPESTSHRGDGRVCFQVITDKTGPSPIEETNPKCRVSSRTEVVLLPPPDSGLNASSSRKNSLCIQWRPPENITAAEFLYKNTKRIWTSLMQLKYHPPYMRKNNTLPHYRCHDIKDEPLLSDAGDSNDAAVSSLITLQLKVRYAGQKSKHDYQVQVPYRKFEGAPTEAFPTIFIASLAAAFAMLLVFFIVCLLYRRLTPSKSGGNRILPQDSLSGSIGGLSSLRAETPVNSGGPERVELMATLSRISQMPIHNSLMPVDNPLYLDHTSDLPSDQDLKSLPHFPRTALTLVDYLGSGAFGNVYAGEACDIHGPGTGTVTVAVKTLQPNASGSCKKWSRVGGSLIWGRDQCSMDTTGANFIRRQMEQEPMQQQFLAEALLMAQFHHDHILPLIGVCLDPHPDGPYMLLEYMDKGDLSNYLKAMRSATPALTLSQLLQMAVQVAMGCKYLEDLHFVHRDLAARNCLVSSLPNNGAIVKVGDFGLARDIYRNDYYRMEMDGKVPFKWMSPESLMDRTWTTKADVWSYGVLVWEIMSLGQQPYPARTNHEVLQFLKDGGRLEKPEKCPDDIYKIMNWCWAFNSEDRPSFAQLVIQLEHLFNHAQRNSGLLRQNRHGSPAGLTSDAGSTRAAERNPSPAVQLPTTPVDGEKKSVIPPQEEICDDANLDEDEMAEFADALTEDAESSVAAAAAATTHKLRLLSSSPSEDGIVYHVFGDAPGDRSSRVKRSRCPSGPAHETELPAFIYSPLPAFSQSPRSPTTPDDDGAVDDLNHRDGEPNEAVSFRFDSPCTMTSSLVSSLATPPITPLFHATPPTTPHEELVAATLSVSSIPSASLSNASNSSSSAIAPSRSSSLRSNRRTSPVLPFSSAETPAGVTLPVSPPPTPALGTVDVSSVRSIPTATVRPIGHHSQIATPSSTLQRSQVPRDVKRPRMPLLQCPPSHAITLSASQTISGYPNHASSSSAHSLSPAKHSVGFFQGDVMTTSFPSDKTVQISHPLKRTSSLEERGGRFRRLQSLNKLLDFKSKTSPAIIPESPPQAARPAKSCLRRGQRTISGGESREVTGSFRPLDSALPPTPCTPSSSLQPPYSALPPTPCTPSSSPQIHDSEVSLEETIACDLQPETRKFMLLQPPPPPRRNGSANGSLDSVKGDLSVVDEGNFTVNQSCPVTPCRPIIANPNQRPEAASIDASDGVVVSIRGSIGSTAPVHFHRFPSDCDCSVSSVSMTTMSSFGGSSSQPLSIISDCQYLVGDRQLRPAMTTFGDPNQRLQRSQQLQLRTYSQERGDDFETAATLRSPSASTSDAPKETSIPDNASSQPPSGDKFRFDDLFASQRLSTVASRPTTIEETGRKVRGIRDTEVTPMSFSSSSASLSSGSSSFSASNAPSDAQNAENGMDNARRGTDEDPIPVKIVQCHLQRASPPQDIPNEEDEDHIDRHSVFPTNLKNCTSTNQSNRRPSPEDHHYQNQNLISHEL